MILIENDSIVIKIKENVKIPLRHSNYLSNLSEYIPFQIKKKILFKLFCTQRMWCSFRIQE